MNSTIDNVAEWVVVLVDDHYDNIMVAKTTLEFYGAEVHTAKDGEMGLALIETITPTIILLDISMPVMNGWDMLKQLHKMDKLAHVPILAVTAHAMDNDREKVLKAGFDEYISKPYHIQTLIPSMKAALEKKLQG